jgi:hypothetical protein
MRMYWSASRHPSWIKSAGIRRNMRYVPLSNPLAFRGVCGIEVVT